MKYIASFSPEENTKTLFLLLPKNIPPIDGSYGNRVIKSSYKKFVHLSKMLIICNKCRKSMKAGMLQKRMVIIGGYIAQ